MAWTLLDKNLLLFIFIQSQRQLLPSQMLSFSWIVYLGGAITCFTIIHHVIIILKTLFENSNLPQQYKQLKVFATLIFVANLLWNVINLPVGFIQFDHYIFGCRFFFGVIMVIYIMTHLMHWFTFIQVIKRRGDRIYKGILREY
eukprot:494460_1